MTRYFTALILALLLLVSPRLPAAADEADRGRPVSGAIVDGYRVLKVPQDARGLELTVFRGDYVKFEHGGASTGPLLSIPDLEIERRLPTGSNEAPHFKMERTGVFPFTLGDAAGRLVVVDYRQPSYREVSVREAEQLIRGQAPLVLDVRTPAEFEQVRLGGAVLIPVQELQRRWREIANFKDREVLIYCATGNRSTVASKILIDNGFTRVVNMRGGIKAWGGEKLPVLTR